MANSTWLPRIVVPATKDNTTNLSQHQPRSRPLPLRVRTFSQSTPPTSPADQRQGRFHARNNSFTSSPITPSDQISRLPHGSYQSSEPSDIFDSPRGSLDSNDSSPTYNYPATPETSLPSARNSLEVPAPEILPYDFTQIDYELSRAKVLGEGLWSTVYLAEQKPGISSSPSPSPQSRRSRSIPSISFTTKLRVRQQTTSTLFAVKTPTRPDSPIVFRNEAKILTHLQRRSLASHHIVTFHGYDQRNSSLVFEALFGGSLESLNSRLKQMTEVARHLEIISLFPGLAVDLIGGLEFLHANGVVHADIKAGNVLLDISEHATDGRPVIRARYIDFSAAFLAGEGEGEAGKYAGGTWDYMAPEQMRPRATPTFASDVWSLGVTLLVVLCGGSPWTAACGGNNFMLREAVKSGDAVGFARMDSTVKKRLDAVQDLVDCCRFALKKEPEKRINSAAWAGWVEGWSDGQEVEMMG